MAKLSIIVLAAGLVSTTLSQSLGSISRTVILDPPATCGPTTVTKIHTTTYTSRHHAITSTVTELTEAPHSCYTATEVASIAYCPLFNSATCGVHPDCVVLRPTTIPCKDACCPSTPTVTVAHCPTSTFKLRDGKNDCQATPIVASSDSQVDRDGKNDYQASLSRSFLKLSSCFIWKERLPGSIGRSFLAFKLVEARTISKQTSVAASSNT
ncbi:hypothetical protein V490_08522 [Pseudogymnoascus sp. VKM F-3557]|nr:hypothetical protein V490_08522 [Pseudogymnoascus sp. VKM F-3557]